MKKIIITVLVVLLWIGHALSQTSGTLTVTATTSTAGGNYAPKNIVAIWIENEQGDFIKTLLAYAQSRRTHLNTWEASTMAAGSPFNTVDAITGATRTSHGTRTCNWDGTDIFGNVVGDGVYYVWMELTDKNGTGNFSSFSFSKDTMPVNLVPLNVPSFSSISIDWEPILTFVNEEPVLNNVSVYPNPTDGVFTVKGDHILKVTLRNMEGRTLYRGGAGDIDMADYPDGIYFIDITTDKGTVIKKVLKN